jgi:hypothetical protein
LPPGNELNNREWATLVWLGVGAVFLLWRTDTRTLVGSAVRTAAHLALLIPATLMWAWTALVVFVAYRLRLWAPDLIKDTVIWSIGPAVGLFFSVTNISKDPQFFRRAALSTIKYSVLIEFYVNLRVFNFPVELLVLLPGITLLALLTSVAGMDEKYRPAKRVLAVMLAVVGILIVVYVTGALVSSWRQEDPWHDLRELALPVWLTLGFLPFLFALSLFAGYQAAFLRIDFFAKEDRRARRRAKVALVVDLNVRTYLVAKFGGGWLTQIAQAQTLDEARAVVRRYHAANPGSIAQRIEPELDSF